MRQALEIAIDYMNERLEDHDCKYQRHPATEAERINILADIETVKEALANHIPDTTKMVAQPEQDPYDEVFIAYGLPQPEQEPVACIGYWNQKTGAYYKPDQISASHQKLIEDGILRRCYTTPPQRTWVGLTATEEQKLMCLSVRNAVLTTASILKEKNGA